MRLKSIVSSLEKIKKVWHNGSKMIFHRTYYSSAKKNRKWLKSILRLAGYLILFGIIALAGLFIYFAKDLPDPSKIDQRQIVQSTKIYDRTGTVILYDVHGEEKRTVVELDQISKYLQQATIATEDANFYDHFGLDFKGIARAIWGVMTFNRSAGGGSTITQQFIKKSMLTDARSYTRKAKEWILALELEAKYSKDEILGFYLNQIPYGSNAYGAEAASQTFFNKPAKDLTLAESALLAGLPQAPSYYSPFGSHPEDMKARQEYILDRMQKLGYVSGEETDNAKKEKLNFTKIRQSIKAPHFVMYIKEYLENEYGKEVVEQGGLKVYTTLDWDLQQAGQELVEEGAKNNEKKFGAKNAALVAVDPKTGQVLAMVGSRDYFDIENDGNVNVSIRGRQPGSSFKPFAYALAFEKGLTPDTVLFDLKTEFVQGCPPDASIQKFNGIDCYNPQNYDNSFRGPVTLRQALAQSLNIPAVKILYIAGVPETIELARSMGISTFKDPNRYGLALVLGGGEIKLLDEVAAYGTFAADGINYEKTAILKIENAQGQILEEFKLKSKRIFDSQIARQISDILTDNEARTPTFGPNSPLYIKERPTAVKTGTTEHYKDAWTVGYTPSLAVGVWAGNNDNKPMHRAGAGMYAAAPIWNSFMKKAYQLKATSTPSTAPNAFALPVDTEPFAKPDPRPSDKPALNGQIYAEKKYKVDKISGKLATDLTPPELIQEVSFQDLHTILYYIDKKDPRGDPPKDPASDSQFSNWEAPIIAWAQSSGWSAQRPPTEYDDIHTQENQPSVTIMTPGWGETISEKNNNAIRVLAFGRLGIKQVDFFFDDEFLGTAVREPYEITFNLPDRLVGNKHTIKVRAYDQALNRQEAQAEVLIFASGVLIELPPSETILE